MPPDAPADITQVRLAIVNDFEIIVAGIAQLLGDHPDVLAIEELSAGLPVLSDIDVILYDTFGRTTVDDLALRRLIGQHSAKVVVYTWDVRDDTVARARAIGAVACLSKELDGDEMLLALMEIHAGRTVASPRVWAGQDSATTSGAWPGQSAQLTPREAEILVLVTRGLTNHEIAGQLFLSINSIKSYIRHAYRKIGVTRRAQAVVWGMEHGLRPADVRILPD